MISILEEDALPTAAAARWINERIAGSHVSPVAVWRWMSSGVVAADGERIYLEYVRVGRRKFITSRQAIVRFTQRLANRPQSAGQIARDRSDEAARSLAAEGFFL